MKNDIFKVRIHVVPVPAPARWLEVDFHVTGNGGIVIELQNSAPEIGAAFDAQKAGVEYSQAFAISGHKVLTLQTLMLPDCLQELFRRHCAAVPQQVHGPTLLAPRCVEISRPPIHAAIFHAAVFAGLGGKVKKSEWIKDFGRQKLES